MERPSAPTTNTATLVPPQEKPIVQACRPEDRLMLATPAGTELLAKVFEALCREKSSIAA